VGVSFINKKAPVRRLFEPKTFHLIKSDIPKIKNEENNYTNKKDIKYS